MKNDENPDKFALPHSLIFAALFGLLSVFVAMGSAQAHSFQVAILQSPEVANTRAARHFVDGFMLATTEQDAHANQESDGHLGGLDVYVTLFEATPISELTALGMDIVVLNSAEPFQGMVGSAPEGGNPTPIILFPQTSLFEQMPDIEGIDTFRAAFLNAYGTQANRFSAAGYNTARRIAVAVRAQGGVADQSALEDSFLATAKNFDWQ